MKKIIILLHSLVYLFSGISNAQVNTHFKTTVPKAGTEVRRLMESLIGQGIVLKNYSITRTSAPDAFGYFEDPSTHMGITKGLLMSTGGISNLTAKNTASGFTGLNDNNYTNGMVEAPYPELSRLLKNQPPTHDPCVIELDIIPTSDTLSFNYVFGSEEYDEYVGSQFNDVFAFFISGKGINGEKNLALVPGTEIPVSINTINGGTTENDEVKGANPSYYVRNQDGHVAIEFDGLTRLMEIRQPVTPYETYHLKIAIADVGDGSLDSGVFIEGQSFISYEKSYYVLFDYNSKEIEGGYKTMLHDFVTVYRNKPAEFQGKILITGHTDGDGSPEYNNLLASQRAAEVYQHLKNEGLDVSDMTVSSKGEHMPRSDNYNETGKQLNRRVELKICGSLDKYLDAKGAELEALPEKTSIEKNYPNPFYNSTTLRTVIQPEVKNAVVTITDPKGALVKTIYVLERGRSETYFGAEELGNGNYQATLYADGAIAGSIKMVVQK